MERIQASLLIPGNGDPIRDGVLVLDGDRISFAGPAADAPARGTCGLPLTPASRRCARSAASAPTWPALSRKACWTVNRSIRPGRS
jgi:hypothetical protein